MKRTLAPLPEATIITRRLMHQLGCRSLALVGCVRPSLITSLADIDVYGWDEPQHVAYASALLPGCSWTAIEDGTEGISDLADLFVVLSAAMLGRMDRARLLAIAAAAHALLIIDVDLSVGLGPSALRQVADTARRQGLRVVHGELIAASEGDKPRRSSPAVLVDDGHDERAGFLVATGFHGLRLDPAFQPVSDAARPARVCIVSYEIVGPSRNGGIGTANTSLATSLARAGQEVTLIYSGEPRADGEHQRWTDHFGAAGIRYLQLSREAATRVQGPFINYGRAWGLYEMVRALHRELPFDAIHGPECQGHLAFIALAKRQGLDFEDAEIVTGVHSPSRWCAEANRQPFGFPSWLADETIERASVEAADVVVSPSGYMLSYLRDRGWRLPDRSFVQQYIRSDAARGSVERAGGRGTQAVDELVFFARLETRKGLEAFCDVLDLLVEPYGARSLSVTFLGSAPVIAGRRSADYITRRANEWPWPTTLMTEASQPDAVQYLSSRRCLAVMPSLVDNSPNTVYEALALGVPFVASRSGGTGELIAVEDLERCTFAGWPDDDGQLEPVPDDVAPPRFDVGALAAALGRALEEGASGSRPAIDPDVNEHCHLEWHRSMAARPRPRDEDPAPGPSVSTIRVKVGNDFDGRNGGPAKIAVTLREGAPASEEGDSWVRWIDEGRVTTAQAYNAAARAADGELLVFLPAAMSAEPAMIPTLQRAAVRSDADIFLFAVRRGGSPGRGDAVSIDPPGPAVLSLLFPLFHARGFAIRPDVLRELGGFSETDRGGDPTSALLTRALLEGCRLEAVPAILARRSNRDPDGLADGGPWNADLEQQLELLRPFAGATDGLKELPALFRAAAQPNFTYDIDGGESLRDGLRRLGLRELHRLRARGVELRLRPRVPGPRRPGRG